MTEQADNIERVSAKIGRVILEFCRGKATGTPFTADDLRRYVYARVSNTAPGSPDRILRDLRQRGLLDYEVLSRKNSTYRLLGVVP
jgi:hypothetical protein